MVISRLAYDQSDEMDHRPLGYLETEFARIAEVLPPDTLKALARVPIWVEWDVSVRWRFQLPTSSEAITSVAVMAVDLRQWFRGSE